MVGCFPREISTHLVSSFLCQMPSVQASYQINSDGRLYNYCYDCLLYALMGNLEKIMWWSSHAKIWSQRKYNDKLIHSRLMSLIKIELVLISTSLNWIKSIMLISIQGNTVKICLISTTNGEKVVSFLLVLIFSIMNCMVIPLCAANELSAFLASAVTFNTDYIQDQLLILTFNT